MRPDKRTIRLRFARAAATYDRQAVVQQQVADRLLHLLSGSLAVPPGRVLEIGCSTGMLTEKLVGLCARSPSLFINDLVPAFKSHVSRRVGAGTNLVFLAGDIESISLPADLDLVVSSSTFHWLADLPALLDRLYTVIVPGGLLCFSIYGWSNLKEIRELTGIGLDYYHLPELRQLVARKFQLLAAEEEIATQRFSDPRAVLQHLRRTGVNALGAKPWTRARLEAFSREYRKRYGSGGEVPLTYHPLYCLARKR